MDFQNMYSKMSVTSHGLKCILFLKNGPHLPWKFSLCNSLITCFSVFQVFAAFWAVRPCVRHVRHAAELPLPSQKSMIDFLYCTYLWLQVDVTVSMGHVSTHLWYIVAKQNQKLLADFKALYMWYILWYKAEAGGGLASFYNLERETFLVRKHLWWKT